MTSQAECSPFCRKEQTTFALDSNTKKKGTIDKGKRVAVYSHYKNGEPMAAEVKAEPKKSYSANSADT